MKEVKIICFYWVGDRWRQPGDNISDIKDVSFQRHLKRVGRIDNQMASTYVNNLYKGVLNHTNRPFEFICFTNENLKVMEGVNIRPFEFISQRGVLPRMFMFSEQAGLFGHQVLSLDLDVIICGELDSMLSYEGSFITRTAFAPGEGDQLDGDIMGFRAGKETESMFWDPLKEDVAKVEEITQGRERLWVRQVTGNIADTWQKLYPGKVVSYKRHVVGKGIPKEASIISCHGYPRPHQIKDKEIVKLWK